MTSVKYLGVLLEERINGSPQISHVKIKINLANEILF